MSLTSSLLAFGLVVSSAFAQKPGTTAAGSSPAYNYIYQNPLPIPAVASPSFTTTFNGRTIDYYSLEVSNFTQQVYPNLGPAHMTGYNGTAPGPTFRVTRGHETVVRCYNQGGGPAAMHLHGSYTHSPWDGWASDEMQVGEYKDYYYPNSEVARSIWYHDHSDGTTAHNAYYGQAGSYIIYDPAEDSLGLPSGDYDIPLAIVDKTYTSNGDLASPSGNILGFYGDTIEVNGQPWPYLSVEPRKYRFRFYDMSLSRPYDLQFVDSSSNPIPFQVIASDSGLFGSPVSTSDLVIAMGERYEVVFDFTNYSGSNVTLTNILNVAGIPSFTNTGKVMKFVVGTSVSDSSNNGAVPSTLNGNIDWPTPKSTSDYTFRFQQGGEAAWTINGVDFADVNNRILAKPAQGSTQLWTLVHTGGPVVHPVHIHLVNLQVVSRTGGSRGVLPYEKAGLKDVVLLEPGETVQVLAYYGPWNGIYMFHCHNLIHEDNNMMAAFNVTLLESLGYSNASTSLADPMDTRFSPQEYNASAYTPDAISSAVLSLASLNAYITTSVSNSVSSTTSSATSSSTPTTTSSTDSSTSTSTNTPSSPASTSTPTTSTSTPSTTDAVPTSTQEQPTTSPTSSVQAPPTTVAPTTVAPTTTAAPSTTPSLTTSTKTTTRKGHKTVVLVTKKVPKKTKTATSTATAAARRFRA